MNGHRLTGPTGRFRAAIVAKGHGSTDLRPGLGRGAFDNMPLNPPAMRTGKGSQIVAQTIRLNRRQLHGRTASRALRTLVLRVEHGVVPQFGALSSPASQPVAFDWKGSHEMTLIST